MQIARCFRDEDPRADRQPEFTQVDVEMSFVQQDDVLDDDGRLDPLRLAARARTKRSRPLPRLTYAEAMRRYGTDKPDLRFGLELVDVAELFEGSEFALFARLAAERREPRRSRCAIRAARRSRGAISTRSPSSRSRSARRAWRTSSFAPDGVKGSIAQFVDEPLAREAARAHRRAGRRRDPVRRRCVTRRIRRRRTAAARDRRPARAARPEEVRVLLGAAAFRSSSATRRPARSRSRTIRSPRRCPARKRCSTPTRSRSPRSTTTSCSTATSSAAARSVITSRSSSARSSSASASPTSRSTTASASSWKRCSYGAPPHGGMALGIDRIAMIAGGEDSHSRRHRVPEESSRARRDDGRAVLRPAKALTNWA